MRRRSEREQCRRGREQRPRTQVAGSWRMRVAILAIAGLLTAAISAAAALPTIELRPVTTINGTTTGIVNAGDTRLFLVAQPGKVMIWDGTSLLATPFLDVSSIVSNGSERGLLGLAFHPRYRENGLFFIDYTNVDGNTGIARGSVSATDPNRADPLSLVTLLTIAQPFDNHNGGELQFGPDGYLYIGM